jgi:hypothetical protein
MLEDIPNIAIRAVGNAALSIGFRALCQALKSPATSEGEEVALRVAESAADWYTVALQRLETLPIKEQMYATPQNVEGLIEFLLKQEAQEPTKELLEAVGVTAEQYREVAAQALKEQKNWIEANRADLEVRWEALITNSDGRQSKNLIVAATEVAGRVLSKMDRIRASRLKAFVRGWTDALGELALLKEYEKRLFAAWKNEGGRDDDLIE